MPEPMQAWRASQSTDWMPPPACSQHHILELHNCRDIGRQALMSPSSSSLGGDQALESDCPQLPSPLLFGALEETIAGGQKLLESQHVGLQKSAGHPVLLLESFYGSDPDRFQKLRIASFEHVEERAYNNKLSQRGAKQEDPIACNKVCRQRGGHSRVDFQENNKQQQLEQLARGKTIGKGKGSKPQGELEQLSQQKSLQQEKQATHSNNSLGLRKPLTNNHSLGREEQQASSRSSSQNLGQACMILVDTGAELSVAPRDFAGFLPLSPLEDDQKLRTADGRAIEAYGIRTVQLLSQGFKITISFVIGEVERPLLGLGSLLKENLSLHLDNTLGHYLGNSAGEKIQLKQDGLQLYLVACPAELELTPCSAGNLLQHSLLPEAKKISFDLGKMEVQDEGGATSFSLENLEQTQLRNNQAVGTTTALPKRRGRTKRKQKGQNQAVNKRELEKTNFMEKTQLALLTPQDPRSNLDEQASKDLSLKVILTLSLMKRWQLITTRVRIACPPEQLRMLGLSQSQVDTKILIGDQLCVMMHENTLLIGGAQAQQDSFLAKLSAFCPLDDTNKLAENNPLIIFGRSLDYSKANKSISLSLPSAFYNELLERYSLENATALGSPKVELGTKASSWNHVSLDAEKTQLYRRTVADLQWSTLSRPDISFSVQTLAQSFWRPTVHDQEQLVKVLKYLRGTKHYCISLQPPKRWERAKNLELLAFSASTWSGACRPTIGYSLAFMGVPLVASARAQATTWKEAELESVRMASVVAVHTRSLLRQLQVGYPLSLRVLTGGALATKLGLSRKSRHLDLWSLFGQLQLSRVSSQHNLAELLTYNCSASGLNRLLLKLKMHTLPAETLALNTGLSLGDVASFGSSSTSFFIGSLRKASAEMAQLDLAQLDRIDFDQLESIDLDKLERHALDKLQPTYVRQLWGKELEKPSKIPELPNLQRKELEKMPDKSLANIDLERTALHKSFLSLLHTSLTGDKLAACTRCFAATPDEGRIAFASDKAAWHYDLQLQLQFWGKELVNHLAVPKQEGELSFTRVSGGASEALAAFSRSSSTSPKQSIRTSHSFNLTSLLFIFLCIMMIGSLTLYSLSFHIRSLDQQLGQEQFHIRSLDKNSSISGAWTRAVPYPELGQEQFHIRSLDKNSSISGAWTRAVPYPELGQEQFHIRSLDKNSSISGVWTRAVPYPELRQEQFHIRSLDNMRFHIQSFENMIVKKLVALLLEWHFAKAASTQLLGNEAWAKYREASHTIVFKKKGDKELPHKLRRQELDCKDLRSDSFRALCPTSFEENTFPEETFTKSSLEKETFRERAT